MPRTSNRFQSLFEQFPSFRLKKEKTAAQPAPYYAAKGVHNLLAETEQPINELDQAHYLLASSIDMLTQANEGSHALTKEQRENIQKVIIEDAEDLAAQVLPPDIVDLLELTPKSPDHIGISHFEDATAEQRTLFLLIHAYDATKSSTIRRASEYMLKEMTPFAVEILKEAYKRGIASGRSIVEEYRRLSAGIDSEFEDAPAEEWDDDLDAKLHLLEEEPSSPDTTRAVGIAAMKATNGKEIDPFVKSYLKDFAIKQKAARTQRASRSSK